MNKQEFENKIEWDEYDIGHINISVPIFEKEITFELFSKDSTKTGITDKMFATVNDVLTFAVGSKDKIKDLLWEECNFSFTVADYGCEPQENETAKEAHFREFELNNKEDAYHKCHVKSIQIHQENDDLQNRYAEIKIETATDNYISIIVKNGKVIDYDDDGTYVGGFENDEQSAHHSRSKILDE